YKCCNQAGGTYPDVHKVFIDDPLTLIDGPVQLAAFSPQPPTLKTPYTNMKKNVLALSMAMGLVIAAKAQDCQVKIVVESGCIGENSGWAYVSSIEGATTPTTIEWSNGGNTAYQADLANGTYTVTVTDANKCSA